MGRTFKKNDRWKKDRRDQNFQKSKKFKKMKEKSHRPDDGSYKIEPTKEIQDNDSDIDI